MKIALCLVSLLSAVALAQSTTPESCQCPQVKCPGDDAVALCNCLNNAETLCKSRCPNYTPKFVPCPAKSTTSSTKKVSTTPPPSSTPKSSPTPKASSTPKVSSSKLASSVISAPSCVCPEVYCIQIWPDSCYCQFDAAQACYERCGGPKPSLLPGCPPRTVESKKRNAEPQPAVPVKSSKTTPSKTSKAVTPTPTPSCECEDVFCIQVFPESCYCQNAAKESCYKKCGGVKPELQNCPPLSTSSITTKVRATSTTSSAKPTGTHAVCGGGRASNLSCPSGYECIADPFTDSCGPACDALGICVVDKFCGGIAGLACPAGQECMDDPRDECDPKKGGADCGGLCVWPH